MKSIDVTHDELAPAASAQADAPADFRDAEPIAPLATRGGLTFDVRRGRRNLWIGINAGDGEVAALRLGLDEELTSTVHRAETDDGVVFEYATRHGALRTKISVPDAKAALVRCTTSLLPSRETVVPRMPRDVFALGEGQGTVHTAQRGLRTGIVFASAGGARPFSIFYWQNFSALTAYFAATKQSPAGTVGGTWPELGYALPGGGESVVPEGCELVVSDVYLSATDVAPQTDADAAAMYLDLFAQTYLSLDRPATAYHDWPTRAAQTLRDLSLSPDCSYVRRGMRYAKPYVGDDTKPPESMVQLTLAVNTDEYARWREHADDAAHALAATSASFFDEGVGSLVRWLPGDAFGGSQAEENMNHRDMDSWYLHHALFNLSRLASGGDRRARDLFERSLPYAMRVARRFNYRWPIFFDLQTLDVVRAESEPGKGGEHDVAGLYALVMLHAHELFGEREFLDEAERGVLQLRDLGFALGYQMNTTGFAAEAALRLWKITRNRRYLHLSEVCMANLFDNMWLWQCAYGNAEHYPTFFGLFPLRDAPYVAAYEEVEAQAKFHEYLSLGGDDIRPSLRLLAAEYQRYSLDRGWFYYPDALPHSALAGKSRNGRVVRSLAIPVEDLRDGWDSSGQVGQEIYGAGLALVYTTRHYEPLGDTGCLLYSDYPMYDLHLSAAERRATWRADGDPRCGAELRVIPHDPNLPPLAVSASTRAGEVVVALRGTRTAEGHACFAIRGGQTIQIRWDVAERAPEHAVEIGGFTRGRRP